MEIKKRGRGRPPRNPEADRMTADSTRIDEKREYECVECDKKYASYQGLYLHRKIKHSGQGGYASYGSRGGGRPRLKGTTENYGGTGPTSEGFLRVQSRTGGPTDPVCGFSDSVNLLFGSRYRDYTFHPMYQYMSSYSFTVTPRESGDFKLGYEDVSKDIQQLTEVKRNMLNADQIFCLYLRDCSKSVNENYYRTMVQFVLMFADALNMYGWQKRAEHELKDFNTEPDYEKKLKQRLDEYDQQKTTTDFCSIHNCEFAPEICNEFITLYLEEAGRNPSKIGRAEMIELTQHLCHWLFTNRLTCSKLSMV